MFDVMSYADRNDVEVSIRKGHDGRTVWEIFLRDRRLGMTEFTRIIDIEINGRFDKDAYIEKRCEEMMDKIRSARMMSEYSAIEKKSEAATMVAVFILAKHRRRRLFSQISHNFHGRTLKICYNGNVWYFRPPPRAASDNAQSSDNAQR